MEAHAEDERARQRRGDGAERRQAARGVAGVEVDLVARVLLVPVLHVVAALGRDPVRSFEIAPRLVGHVAGEPHPVEVEADGRLAEAIATSLGVPDPVEKAALQLAEPPAVTERDEAEAMAKHLLEVPPDLVAEEVFGNPEGRRRAAEEARVVVDESRHHGGESAAVAVLPHVLDAA